MRRKGKRVNSLCACPGGIVHILWYGTGDNSLLLSAAGRTGRKKQHRSREEALVSGGRAAGGDAGRGSGIQRSGMPGAPFYYRKKGWKEPVLFEAMEAALHTAAGMTDTYVHPDILRLLAPENRGRWQPRSSTVKMLTKHLLGQQAQKALARTDMVTVLLGQPHETAQQLEMTWELLEPYLPRVNRMLLYYEEQETLWDKKGRVSGRQGNTDPGNCRNGCTGRAAGITGSVLL